MRRTHVSHARWIRFTVFASSAVRRSSCGLVNAELFIALADGSGKASRSLAPPAPALNRGRRGGVVTT